MCNSRPICDSCENDVVLCDRCGHYHCLEHMEHKEIPAGDAQDLLDQLEATKWLMKPGMQAVTIRGRTYKN